jgi:hypothetical protein
MTTKIKVSVNGKLKFIWDGDTQKHLAMWADWIRNTGKAPTEYADQCIMQLGTGYLNEIDEDRQRRLISIVV